MTKWAGIIRTRNKSFIKENERKTTNQKKK